MVATTVWLTVPNPRVERAGNEVELGKPLVLAKAGEPRMSCSEATESPWERALEAGRVWGPERGEQGAGPQECRPNTVRIPLALSGCQQFPSPRKP